ncbi:hypothetical protein WMO13_03570 [Ignatzschineria larvae DSM 13226]|uniref:Uncharacterized protein n=1 Tax=Ignatzschineria larvae DSM 13226 TaxID=1111732 RepID=A0ABZ3C2Z6_9GAMM|nr:hypothetical protein [Ignatzschineria larvae]
MHYKPSVEGFGPDDKVINENSSSSEKTQKKESSNANGACEICERMQCLCEVILTLKDGTGEEKAFYWESKEETPIPDQIFLIDSGKSADEDDKEKNHTIDFEIIGECTADEEIEECCAITQIHHTFPMELDHQLQYKKGSFTELKFDPEHAYILGSIDEKGNIRPKGNQQFNAYNPSGSPQHKMLLKEVKDAEEHTGSNLLDLNIVDWHLNFLFLNKLDDYPFSLQSLLVYECNLGNQEDRYGAAAYTQIVSMPYYSQSLNVSLEFSGDKDDAGLEFSYVIALDKSETTITSPEIGLKIPYIGKMLKNLSQKTGFNKFGVRGGLKLPKITISAKAELADGYFSSNQSEEENVQKGLIIKRSGTFKGDPILGAEIAFDILGTVSKLLSKAPTPQTQAISLALNAINVFNETAGIRDVDDVMTVLKGPKESWWRFWRLRAAATIFLQGSVDIEGELEFKDSGLLDSPEDFTQKKEQKDKDIDFATGFELGGKAQFGIYGGAWAEGRILGFGAGAGAAMKAVVIWKLLYKLEAQQITGWYEGFELTIKGEAAVGDIDRGTGNANSADPSLKLEVGGISLGGEGYTASISGGVEMKLTSISGHIDTKVFIPGESKSSPCLIYEF